MDWRLFFVVCAAILRKSHWRDCVQICRCFFKTNSSGVWIKVKFGTFCRCFLKSLLYKEVGRLAYVCRFSQFGKAEVVFTRSVFVFLF